MIIHPTIVIAPMLCMEASALICFSAYSGLPLSAVYCAACKACWVLVSITLLLIVSLFFSATVLVNSVMKLFFYLPVKKAWWSSDGVLTLVCMIVLCIQLIQPPQRLWNAPSETSVEKDCHAFKHLERVKWTDYLEFTWNYVRFLMCSQTFELHCVKSQFRGCLSNTFK